MVKIAFIVCLSTAAFAAQGDATRGARLFTDLKCAGCHGVNATGTKTAPALTAQPNQAYTPNTMAAAMWTHATNMFDAMLKAGIKRPHITPEQAADIYAFLARTAAPDKPGDPQKGRQIYEAKFCASCHDAYSGAPDLTPLAGTVTPYTMVSSLWDHGSGMLARMVAKNTAWQTLSTDEMGHLIAYLNTKK
jgi:cytochrome c553